MSSIQLTKQRAREEKSSLYVREPETRLTGDKAWVNVNYLHPNCNQTLNHTDSWNIKMEVVDIFLKENILHFFLDANENSLLKMYKYTLEEFFPFLSFFTSLFLL